MKVLGSGQVLRWHELHMSWIARRLCSSPPQIMWPVWENEFLTSESRFEKKWKWSPDNWKWIWESESEFEKANRGARASRSNSTLFALLTHFLPRKRDSSKSILCHTQMRPRSSTQSFSLLFWKMMFIGLYDDLKAMSKKFLRLWIQGFYLSRDDPIQGFSFVHNFQALPKTYQWKYCTYEMIYKWNEVLKGKLGVWTIIGYWLVFVCKRIFLRFPLFAMTSTPVCPTQSPHWLEKQGFSQISFSQPSRLHSTERDVKIFTSFSAFQLFVTFCVCFCILYHDNMCSETPLTEEFCSVIFEGRP